MKNECSIVRDLLPLYAEGMLSEDSAAFVKEHLDTCKECRALSAGEEPSAPTDADTEQRTGEAGVLRTLKKKLRKQTWCAIFITAAVVLLSIISLVLIIIAGIKNKACRSYGICAGIALFMMLVGAMGMKIVPADYFGIIERFSVFAATGFNAALGLHLFCMKPNEIKE